MEIPCSWESQQSPGSDYKWAILKNLQYSLCRIILGTAKLTPCLCTFSSREANWGNPYAKSLRGLTQVRVLLTPNPLWQGPYWKCKGRFLERLKCSQWENNRYKQMVLSFEYQNWHVFQSFLGQAELGCRALYCFHIQFRGSAAKR